MRILAGPGEEAFDPVRFANSRAYRASLDPPQSFEQSISEPLHREVLDFPSFRDDTSVTSMPDELELGYYIIIGHTGGCQVLATFAFVVFGDRIQKRYALRPTILVTHFGRDENRL
jgi:hypothetical protein